MVPCLSSAWSIPVAGDHVLAAWLFLRGTGALYAIAFLSLAPQVLGLVGSRGILPVRHALGDASGRGTWRDVLRYPTLAWLTTSDRSLLLQCWGGAAAGALAAAGVLPLPMLLACWLLYLSLLNCCGEFLGFQWDILLVETGFLAILLAPVELFAPGPSGAPPWPVVALAWWLLFRLVFSSGFVKLASRDPTWRDLTALTYHYMTQPLPGPLSWHAHWLPRWFQRASCGLMLALELGAPFLLFMPQPLRAAGGISIALLMLLVFATGNFAFFNLNTLLLCLFAFDDAQLASALGPLAPGAPEHAARQLPAWLVIVPAAVVLLVSFDRAWRTLRLPLRWPRLVARALDALEPWRLANPYGLFAVMTTERPEIVVEGSDDGREWRAYEFRWKPGDVRRRPRQCAPHQPRLDWQAWFAALGPLERSPWLVAFLARLLDGSPEVRRLLRSDPFRGAPPRHVRALLYRYELTTPAERRATGAWWKRELLGPHAPVMTKPAGR